MKSVTIKIPEGYEVDSFDKSSGEIKFKQVSKAQRPVTERIKTVQDVLSDHGISQSTFDDGCEYLSSDERAYRIIKLLVESLNEGWKPNWRDSNEYKYFPWFEMDGSSGFRFNDHDYWSTGSNVGSRLCFKSRELAVYAGTQFLDVYKQFMTL